MKPPLLPSTWLSKKTVLNLSLPADLQLMMMPAFKSLSVTVILCRQVLVKLKNRCKVYW